MEIEGHIDNIHFGYDNKKFNNTNNSTIEGLVGYWNFGGNSMFMTKHQMEIMEQ